MNPLASVVRCVTFGGLVIFTNLAWPDDESLARDFAECSEVAELVAKLSKDASEQEVFRKSSRRFRVNAYALASSEFVELERLKARHDLVAAMQTAIGKSDPKQTLQDHMARKVRFCIELEQKNEEAMKPKVKQLHERLKAENKL